MEELPVERIQRYRIFAGSIRVRKCQCRSEVWVPRTSSAAFGASRAAKLTPGPNAPSSAIALGHLGGGFALLPEPRGVGSRPGLRLWMGNSAPTGYNHQNRWPRPGKRVRTVLVTNTAANCIRPGAVLHGVRGVGDACLDALLAVVSFGVIRPIHGRNHALLINALITKYCGGNALVHLKHAEKKMHRIDLIG
jgi:hypothetical protein